MERIPHVVARGGTLQGNIKTQPGMANVLTARANRGEMLVFNLQNVFVQIVKTHSGEKSNKCNHYKEHSDTAQNGKCSHGSS